MTSGLWLGSKVVAFCDIRFAPLMQPHPFFPSAGTFPLRPSNRFGLDYRAEGARRPAVCPIIDFHAHINGDAVIPIWKEAADAFGVSKVFTQVRLEDADIVKSSLGERVEFVAFPNFRATDRGRAFREGFLEDIPIFHERFGARIVKFWNAPRLRDFFPGDSGKDVIEFDSEWRVRAAELAQSLGMMFMVHVADPDTWFATKYSDPEKYGRKIDHYRGLEVMLDRFPAPWIAAHMGGWAEDLPFLDGLLSRHSNLYLDTSATKWVIRALGQSSPSVVRTFFQKWRGRILFGSDIVTTNEHVTAKIGPGEHPMADLASNADEAFDLYASRYLSLRTVFETAYAGESPIADPDLAMVDPSRFDRMSAPPIAGISLPASDLRMLYSDAATGLMSANRGPTR